MHIIKHIPEDFIVNEVTTVKPQQKGKFIYFQLWKRDCTTHYALHLISRKLNMPLKRLGFAGNKDRRAVTTQVCSAQVSKEKLEQIDLPNIKLTFLGYGTEPVFLGALEGNNFKITVRNIKSLPDINPKFRNLFGEQRFSVNNAEIGRLIIKKEFERAAKLISETNPSLGKNYFILNHDWLQFLRSVPRQTLVLFIHAYQSYLWNKAAIKSINPVLPVLPVVGFGTEDVDEITEEILRQENIKLSDFIIRELPDLSVEGASRNVFVEAQNLKISELEPDEFFPGTEKVTLTFFLPKGSYATEFIRQNF